jgi:ABC-type uncharacterized transport system auxiliary subunit
MRKMLRVVCLTMTAAALSGCANTSEGRAAALLDAAKPEARAHAISLTGDDMTEARRTGVRLLAILGQWD